MIKSFSCKETARIFDGKTSRKFPAAIQKRVLLVLAQIADASDLIHLRTPPSNRLHSLQGDLSGFWSVSVNKQWRIIFRWEAGQAYEVKITDYH